MQQFVMRLCHTTRDSEFGINVNNQNKDAVVRNLHLVGTKRRNPIKCVTDINISVCKELNCTVGGQTYRKCYGEKIFGSMRLPLEIRANEGHHYVGIILSAFATALESTWVLVTNG